MIGLDANVLIRFLTLDDPEQSKKAAALVESAMAKDEKLLIHHVVLCELVWILETAYDYARNEVAGVLDRILRTAQFEIPQKETAWSALSDYRAGKGDFADHMIARANNSFGATHTVTFDKELKGHRHFVVLQ